MTPYEFTLKFRLPDAAADPDVFVEALAAAGCDDATIGVGQRGRVALAFTREARTAVAAIGSAMRDVRRAIDGVELVEASPDYVGLTDVADIAGCTRQNMRKLMTTHVASFPPAVHEGSASVWHLATVLAWLRDHQRRDIDATLFDVARATMHLNIANGARRLKGVTLPAPFARLLA